MAVEHLEHHLITELRRARVLGTELALCSLRSDKDSALLPDAQLVELACEVGLGVLNPGFVPSAEALEAVRELLDRRR